jgi:hypothetical protein
MAGTTGIIWSRAGRPCRLAPTWLGVALLCVLVGAMLAAKPARAQSGVDILRGAIATQPEAGGTQRSGTDTSAGAAGTQTGQVTLVALVSEESRQRIDQGMIWRVFTPGGTTGRPKLVSTSRDAQPVLRLAPGDYLVNAAFGRAYATKRIKVAAGAQTTETFHLNAGVLRLTAFSSTGERLSDANVRYEIQSDERDQYGQRPRIVGNLRPGMLVRLSSGLYHIVSVYGDANARATADLTVEPAKLSDVVLVHHAAKVTFKLVQRAGGEAMADTQWSIATRSGQVVKESAGALPVHTLAPGSYVVSASSGGRVYRRNFVVKSGESAFVEVLMQ